FLAHDVSPVMARRKAHCRASPKQRISRHQFFHTPGRLPSAANCRRPAAPPPAAARCYHAAINAVGVPVVKSFVSALSLSLFTLAAGAQEISSAPLFTATLNNLD